MNELNNEAEIANKQQYSKFMSCGGKDEMANHKVSECNTLVQKEYRILVRMGKKGDPFGYVPGIKTSQN